MPHQTFTLVPRCFCSNPKEYKQGLSLNQPCLPIDNGGSDFRLNCGLLLEGRS
uniref:Alternative protein GEMIN5 n=1 Tax=Homo sapiens TaxID=9606 RepID=L8ECG2_HUMAN|nr:alternative protein GEMIN5 [Homo sapiens]